MRYLVRATGLLMLAATSMAAQTKVTKYVRYSVGNATALGILDDRAQVEVIQRHACA